MYSLCEEIDDLKQEVAYYKDLFEKERKLNSQTLNDNLKAAQKGVANALMFAMSVSDDMEGNMVIKKEDRVKLAEMIK
jgi:hypothetical protein